MDILTIGEKIRKLRKEKDMSLSELAGEYVDRIRYKYEDDTVETLSPPYAPNYGYLN